MLFNSEYYFNYYMLFGYTQIGRKLFANNVFVLGIKVSAS